MCDYCLEQYDLVLVYVNLVIEVDLLNVIFYIILVEIYVYMGDYEKFYEVLEMVVD